MANTLFYRLVWELYTPKGAEGPPCILCWGPAVTLHEIVPKSLYPEWESDPENSVPLCAACHELVQADCEGHAPMLYRFRDMHLMALHYSKGITDEDFLRLRSSLLAQRDQ